MLVVGRSLLDKGHGAFALVGCATDQTRGPTYPIVGTVDQTTDSIMAACLTSLNTNGEFRGQDGTALSTLY